MRLSGVVKAVDLDLVARKLMKGDVEAKLVFVGKTFIRFVRFGSLAPIEFVDLVQCQVESKKPRADVEIIGGLCLGLGALVYSAEEIVGAVVEPCRGATRLALGFMIPSVKHFEIQICAMPFLITRFFL